MKFRNFLIGILLLVGVAHARPEPTNWMFGVGIGSGVSQIDRNYSESASNKIGMSWVNWQDMKSSTVKDWGVNWELLLGYKHWINEWVGFRYYATVGAQHYKDEVFTAGKVEAGVVEYIGNADILINFWTAETWSIGSFVGLGVGGAYFNSKALDTYNSLWENKTPNTPAGDPVYAGEGRVYKHHVSAAVNLGLRGSFFQKVRNVEARACDEGDGGRKTCRVPVSYYEHSFEFAAKFPLVKYKVTSAPDMLGAYSSGITGYPGSEGKYVAVYKRPGYVVSNPFKFTIRYIFAF